MPAADVTAPTGTINKGAAASRPDVVLADRVRRLVFSEPVTGLTASDIQISGTAPGTLTAIVNGSGDTYEVSISGMIATGTVIANIGAAAVDDLAGNDNLALTFTDNVVQYDEPVPGDTTDPTADIHLAPPVGRRPASTSPVVFEVSFSEQVTGFANADILISGTANPTGAAVAEGPARTS